jgi:transcription elongation factor GreA
MTQRFPMTPAGLESLRSELKQLKEVERPQNVQDIEVALGHGDLRENAEYHAAKERQRFVEARISLLQRRVSDIMLMNLDKLPKDRVGFGSTVHLKDPAGQVITYQLVMPEDADVDQGLISTASPIGRALLNKEEGDEVSVTTPNGSKRFELVRLLTIHDEDPGEPHPGA